MNLRTQVLLLMPDGTKVCESSQVMQRAGAEVAHASGGRAVSSQRDNVRNAVTVANEQRDNVRNAVTVANEPPTAGINTVGNATNATGSLAAVLTARVELGLE